VGEGGRLLAESAARLFLAQGCPSEALGGLTEDVVRPGIANPAWAGWRGLKAGALAGLGRMEEAVELAADEVALLRRWGAPTSLGPALRLLGSLRGRSGVTDLREAVEVLTGTTAAVELARAQVALARHPEVADGEAVTLLRAALSTAQACGARGVARDALDELAVRGHRPEDPATGGPVRVSARERRVLELSAAGLDVNEVAQALFLTPGTVRALLEAASGGPP
jgi:DNA-binding NarL/FixJ family response regulator